MDINKIVNDIAKHYQGKVVSNISFCVEDQPVWKDRINPCTLKMPSLTINFADDTCIIVDAHNAYHEGSKQTLAELHVTFWIGRTLINEWVIDYKNNQEDSHD